MRAGSCSTGATSPSCRPLAARGSAWRDRSRSRRSSMSKLLASLKRQYTILLIEHDMDAVFSLADRISVLVGGRIVASGTADEIRNHPGVRVAYLGEDDDAGDFRADG